MILRRAHLKCVEFLNLNGAVISNLPRRGVGLFKTIETSAMASVNISHEEMVKIIPPLGFGHHKGQHGRVGVVGGCKEYTGAPYFAAMTALRLGADLSHVFCTSDASVPIKSYSPDLIVHPILDKDNAVEQIKQWLPRLHCMVIGPGLGRDTATFQVVTGLLHMLRDMPDMLVVIDGDGLFLVQQCPSLVSGAKNFILTPNDIEYQRLVASMTNIQNSSEKQCDIKDMKILSQSFGGVTIVKKGENDVISCQETASVVTATGSPRRCGGQGDILAGAVGLFSHWAKEAISSKRSSSTVPSSVLGAHTACYFVKHLTCDVFSSINSPSKIGRSMVTNDLVDNIGKSFQNLFKI